MSAEPSETPEPGESGQDVPDFDPPIGSAADQVYQSALDAIAAWRGDDG